MANYDKNDDADAQSIDQRIIDSAQRFESGSPNMMGITALNASLGLLLEIGIDNIQTMVLDNSSYLIDRLSALPDIKILSSTEAGRVAGIVTFQKTGIDNEALYQHLQDNDVICAFRGDGIRFSAHFHTAKQDIDRALDIVRSYSD